MAGRRSLVRVALLTAPVLTTATLFALAITPAIVTVADKVGLLVTGIVLGFVTAPFFEELGWTGFATPELRKRYDILPTGLMMGLLWGVWHLPLFSASAIWSGVNPPALYLAVLLFSWLLPYRVLMVWVYDHTKSLLVAILMHVPIVVGQFVLIPPGLSGTSMVSFTLIFAATLWVFVATIIAANGRQIVRSTTGQTP